MTPEEFESIKAYVGLDDQDVRHLRAFLPSATAHFDAIVDDFYRTILTHPSASAVFTGGDAQVARLKGSLKRWMHRVLSGPHDPEYLAAHGNIGRVHVRIRLPQHFMFTAMNRVRTLLVDIAQKETSNAPATTAAIGRVLDLELAIMLDSYRTDLVEQMRTQERLATVGEMAATIAHELRNPLGAIQSSLYIVQRHVERLRITDSVVTKHHQRISDQVDLCGATISNLLELAKNRQPVIKRFDVRQLIDRAILSLELPAGVNVSVTAAPELTATADPDQLHQVLLNLLSNAVEAMGDSGTIQLSSARVPGGLTLSVRDDGPGISPENHGRIFNALFTTKAMGTGLGLGLCRKIIDAHRGKIELVSEPKGAHFRIWLPETEETT